MMAHSAIRITTEMRQSETGPLMRFVSAGVAPVVVGVSMWGVALESIVDADLILTSYRGEGPMKRTPQTKMPVSAACYQVSRTTPQQTRMVATQRRRSTFSCRKYLAAKALATNVRAADAGPTRLRSAQESPTRLLKNAIAMKKTPAKSTQLEMTRAITETSPWRRRRSPRSPMRRMASATRTSPAAAAATVTRMHVQL